MVRDETFKRPRDKRDENIYENLESMRSKDLISNID